MGEAVLGEVVEPRVLGLFERGQPGPAVGGFGQGRRMASGPLSPVMMLFRSEFVGERGELAQFVVRAEGEDIDAGHHAGDATVRR